MSKTPTSIVTAEQMRVALLTNFIPPYRAPVFRALASRVDRLRILLSTRMEPNRPWPAQWDGLDVAIQRTLTFRRTWRHPYGFREPLFVHVPYDTIQALRQFAPDAILSAEIGSRSLQAALFAAIWRKRLVIWATLSEHTEEGRGWFRVRLRRFLLRRAQAIIVNGESGARYIRRFGINDTRIRRIPQTTEIAPFLARTLQRDPDAAKRVIYVGRLIELKNLLSFTRAVADWAIEHPQERVSLWFVGDGELRDEIVAMNRPPNLDLRLVGNVPYEQLPEFYAQAGILALPTHADEWGLVINEGMAAGLPILGSIHSQAVEELVTDGVHGWTFEPHDLRAMRNAIHRALTATHDELSEMREAVRRRISSLTPDFVAERIREALSAN